MPQYKVDLIQQVLKTITVEVDDETQAGDVAAEYADGFMSSEDEERYIVSESTAPGDTEIDSIEYIK